MTSAPDRVLTRPFVLAWGACAASFLSFYVLLAAMPIVIIEMGGTQVEVGLLIALFSFSSILSRPWVGRSVDARGARWMIRAGTWLFFLAGIGYALFRSVPVFLGIRLFHGLSMSTFGTGAATLIAGLAPPNRRAETMGYWGLGSSIPMAIGPAVGLFVMQGAGFTTLAWLSALFGAVGVAFAYSSSAGGRPNRPPGAEPSGWVSRPALPPALALVSVTVPYGVVMSFLPLLAIERSIPNIGLYFTAYAACLILSRSFTGRLADRFGRASVIIPGMAICAAGIFLISLAHDLPVLLTAAALYGFGFGSTQPALAALTVDLVPTEGRGVAMSTFGGAWELGMMIGGGLAGPILVFASYETLFALSAVPPILGIAYFVQFTRARRRPQPLPAET